MISVIIRRINHNCTFRFKTLKRFVSADIKAVENVITEENHGHIPVMPAEVLAALQPQSNQVFIDMTFGGGGHSRLLLKTAPIKLYCLDRDPVAFEKAKELSSEYGSAVTPLLGRFSEMEKLLSSIGVEHDSVDGILIDAGCSSMQMDTAERGFSISKEGLLDMRMDGNRFPKQATAADVLNNLDVHSLAKIFKIYGEEKHSKKIAQALFDAKYLLQTINTTRELADIVQSTLGGEQRHDKLQRTSHVATKIFQALRIFVNDELNELNYGIDMAHTYLKPGGKLAVLTFHSLEDRIVKRQMLGVDLDSPVSNTLRQKFKSSIAYTDEEVETILAKKWKPMYKHVITPTAEEVESNPRSRSAKLRAAEKCSLPE